MQDGTQPAINLDAFSDLDVDVEARLDETHLTLKTALKLQPGSVIALDRAAGNTIDVFVGNVRLASAEVITIEDKLTLRITEFHFEP